MTQDLYSELLGLPEGKRPPDYYVILGLEPFETGREKIHKAVLEQTARLRMYALDPNPDRAHAVQEMLNEVNRAGSVLETPKQKWAYDVALAEERLALPPCPACGRRLAPETVICTECGLHLETGVRLVTVQEAATEVPPTPAAAPAPAAGFGLTLGEPPRRGLEGEEEAPQAAPAPAAASDATIPPSGATPLPSMDLGRALEEALEEEAEAEAEEEVVEMAVAAEAQPALAAPPVVRAKRKLLRRELIKGAVALVLFGTGIGIWAAQWGRAAMLVDKLRGPEPAAEPRSSPGPESETGPTVVTPPPPPPPPPVAPTSALADKLLETGSDEVCLQALSGSKEEDVLGALEKLAFVARSPQGALRAKELLYMGYGLSPNDMRRGKLWGAEIGSPSDDDTKELERWAKALLSGKPPAHPPPAWAGEALRALEGLRRAAAQASDGVGGLVALAGALRACREIATAAQGGTGAFQELRSVLESGDPRNRLVVLVRPPETGPTMAPAALGRAGSGPRSAMEGDQLAALQRQLSDGALQERRTAIERLASDGSAQAVDALLKALESEKESLRRLDLMRGLARCRSVKALEAVLAEVKSPNSLLAHEAAVLLGRMLGDNLLQRSATQDSFLLPHSNDGSARMAAHKYLEGKTAFLRKAGGEFPNRLSPSDGGMFEYLPPGYAPRSLRSKQIASEMPFGARRRTGAAPTTPYGPPGQPEADEDKAEKDAGALAAVIAEDLKELARLWKEPPPPSATPAAETARPWTILARGGTLPRAASTRAYSGYARGTYGSYSISRLAPGAEGRGMLQCLSETLQALDGRVRSLPNVPESVTKAAQQILAEAAVGDELADTPLQAVCFKLSCLGRMLVVYAQAQRPDDGPAAGRLEEEFGRRDAEAQSLFEQVAARARFVVEAHLLMAGVESTGGSTP